MLNQTVGSFSYFTTVGDCLNLWLTLSTCINYLTDMLLLIIIIFFESVDCWRFKIVDTSESFSSATSFREFFF